MNLGGYPTVSGLVFALIAVLQAVRAARQMPVQIGAKSIPVWFSWVAAVVAGALAFWAFRSRGA
jgi:hypothetical protein